jgi:BclB C-terminal domain-containing protein
VDGKDGAPSILMSSADTADLSTLLGGLPGQAVTLPLSGDVGAANTVFYGPMISDSVNGPGHLGAQSMPQDGTITSVSFYADTATALSLIGTTITIQAQLYESTVPDGTFTPVPGTLVTAAPSMTGLVPAGSVTSGLITGLSIPVAAQTRLMLVVSATASGLSLVNAVQLENLSLGVGIA